MSMMVPGRHRRTWPVRAAGIAAGGLFVIAVAGFGAVLDGYSQQQYPVAVLGAVGVPRALAFNLLAFVVPGLLAAYVALWRRGDLPDPPRLSARLGWSMLLLSALAFAAQGLLPLGATAADAGGGRLHGVAWALWGMAFASAAVLLWVSALRASQPWTAAGHLAAGLLVFTPGWLAGDIAPVAVAQRAAFAAWFAWLGWAAWMRDRALR